VSLAGTTRAQEGRRPDAGRDLSVVKAKMSSLMDELIFLHDSLVEYKGAGRDKLLLQVRNAIGEGRLFTQLLEKEARPERIDKSYTALDEDLQGIVTAARALPEEERTLKRVAQRVRVASNQLSRSLGGREAPEGRGRGVVRQLDQLAVNSRELAQAVEEAVKRRPAARPALRDVQTFCQAVEQCHKELQSEFKPEQARREFARLDRAWGPVVEELNRWPLKENSYVLEKAHRVDQEYRALFNDLGMEGKRPGITFDRPEDRPSPRP